MAAPSLSSCPHTKVNAGIREREANDRIRPVGPTWLTVLVNQADYWLISANRVSLGMVRRDGRHYHPSLAWPRHEPPCVWGIAAAIPLMLLAPALWNGYPLLQSDTGGYLARWYEGYLVPSRSTVFGLYLHYGEHNLFLGQPGDPGAGDDVDPAAHTARLWPCQTVAAVRIVSLALTLTTALPWLASMLLTDIFAGLSVLVAVSTRASRRQVFPKRKSRAVCLYGVCGGDP